MVWRSLVAASLAASCHAGPALKPHSASQHSQNESEVPIQIQWNDVFIESKTSTTLQVVVNPLLLANSSIRDNALASLELVSADYVRFVPWFPYPKLAVPEIDPPQMENGNCSTSWDFTYADQLLGDFLNSTAGKKNIINFSTTPDWMWITDSPYEYPNDVTAIDWSYNNGTQLRDPTMKEISDYYKRLISWYVNGGFTDECGVYHESGYHWDIDYWEVLNEPEAEHTFSVEMYNQLYDAVTSAIHEVAPQIEFVGMALAYRNVTWVDSFLNASNHVENTPLDWISYHFYATPENATTPEEAASAFQMTDDFFQEVEQMEAARKRQSPNTKTTLNEIGTMDPLGATTIEPGYKIPDEYWVWSGGIYAYVFSKMATMGIDVVGESQLVGYPGQYPSVSMVDWETGLPNARLRVLQLLQRSFNPGDKLLNTTADETAVHAQAFQTEQGEKKILVINKQDQTTTISTTDLSELRAEIVDVSTGGSHWRPERVSNGKLAIPPFAVAVITAM